MIWKIIIAIFLYFIGSGVSTVPVLDNTVVPPIASGQFPDETIPVTDNDEIIAALTDAIYAGETVVNFDMSGYRRSDANILRTISRDYDTILARDPDLQYVQSICGYYNDELTYLSAEIEYMYFIDSQDIFCVIDRPGLYVVLDKKVLKAGESAQVSLAGENASEYRLQVSTLSYSTVTVAEDNHIDALREGTAVLDIEITGEDFSKKHHYAFKINILPEDVPEIYDISGLIAAAEEGMTRSRQSIFIRNRDLNIADMQNALDRIGGGYIICIFYEPTSIYNYTFSGLSLSACVDRLDLIETQAAEIASGIIRPDMTELEKETAIYDYLIQNTEYDYRIFDDPDHYPFDSGTAYGPLFDNTGVCSGYAYALQALFTEAGIECIPVMGESEGEGHMWNISLIDGVYYQMDATFDSGNTEYYGELCHDYFNISDAQMSLDHDWDTSAYPPCTDTRYE